MINCTLKIIVGFSCLILLFSGSVFGEYYYKYTDPNGTLHFTDNLDEVPVNQRIDNNRFDEIKQVAPPLNGNESETAGDSTGENTIQALNKEKRRLEAIHEKLFSKIASLKKERSSAKDQEAVSGYEKKVTALNKEIAAYEKQRAAFDLKLKKFNEMTQNKGEN